MYVECVCVCGYYILNNNNNASANTRHLVENRSPPIYCRVLCGGYHRAAHDTIDDCDIIHILHNAYLYMYVYVDDDVYCYYMPIRIIVCGNDRRRRVLQFSRKGSHGNNTEPYAQHIHIVIKITLYTYEEIRARVYYVHIVALTHMLILIKSEPNFFACAGRDLWTVKIFSLGPCDFRGKSIVFRPRRTLGYSAAKRSRRF